MTVQHKPLFRLFCSEAYQYAHRGTIHLYQMEVERFDGYNGPITLQIADRQIKDLDGADVLETTIPAGRIAVPAAALFAGDDAHQCAGALEYLCSGVRDVSRPLGAAAVDLHRLRNAVHGPDTPHRYPVAGRRPRADALPRTARRAAACTSIEHPFSAAPCKLPSWKMPLPADSRLNRSASRPERPKLCWSSVATRARSSPKATLRFRGTGDLGEGTTVIAEVVVPIRQP